MATSIELRQQLDKEVADMEATVKRNKEQDVRTDIKVWEDFELKREDLTAKIKDAEFLENQERSLANAKIEREETLPKDEKKKEEIYERAFFKTLFKKGAGLTDEERSVFLEKRGTGGQSTTPAAGGLTVPEGFSNQLFTEKALWGGMLAVADTSLQTPTGNDIPWPKLDDTGQIGALITEESTDIVADMTFTNTTLGAYMFTSRVVKVSEEIGMDSAFTWQSILSPAFARRLGVAENQYFTTGTGSGQPQGALAGASSAFTAASATAVTRTELNTLIFSVNKAWRSRSNMSCGFMMSDTTFGALLSVSMATAASDHGPMVVLGNGTNPDTVNGWPVFINNDMPAMTTGLKPIAFGDFSQLKIRKAGPTTAKRFDELYGLDRQIGYVTFERYDSKLIGTNAIKYITMA